MANFARSLASGFKTGLEFGEKLAQRRERERIAEIMKEQPTAMGAEAATPEQINRASLETQKLAEQDARDFGLNTFAEQQMYQPTIPRQGENWRTGPLGYSFGGQQFTTAPTQEQLTGLRFGRVADVIAERDPVQAMRMRSEMDQAAAARERLGMERTRLGLDQATAGLRQREIQERLDQQAAERRVPGLLATVPDITKITQADINRIASEAGVSPVVVSQQVTALQAPGFAASAEARAAASSESSLATQKLQQKLVRNTLAKTESELGFSKALASRMATGTDVSPQQVADLAAQYGVSPTFAYQAASTQSEFVAKQSAAEIDKLTTNLRKAAIKGPDALNSFVSSLYGDPDPSDTIVPTLAKGPDGKFRVMYGATPMDGTGVYDSPAAFVAEAEGVLKGNPLYARQVLSQIELATQQAAALRAKPTANMTKSEEIQLEGHNRWRSELTKSDQWLRMTPGQRDAAIDADIRSRGLDKFFAGSRGRPDVAAAAKPEGTPTQVGLTRTMPTAPAAPPTELPPAFAGLAPRAQVAEQAAAQRRMDIETAASDAERRNEVLRYDARSFTPAVISVMTPSEAARVLRQYGDVITPEQRRMLNRRM